MCAESEGSRREDVNRNTTPVALQGELILTGMLILKVTRKLRSTVLTVLFFSGRRGKQWVASHRRHLLNSNLEWLGPRPQSYWESRG